MAQRVKDLALSLLWFGVTAMAQVPSLVQERPHAAGVPPPPKEKNALSWQVDVGGINPG